MRTPTFTAKRALGLTLAGALAIGGTISVAGNAEAAAAVYKTASATTAAGQVITVLGTNFTNNNGAALFDTSKVIFQTAACTSTVGSNNGTVSVVSDTTLRVTTPAANNVPLSSSKPTKYNLCFYKPSAGALLGTAAVTVYAIPTFTAAIDNTTGPSYGGTKITVTGQDFTAKTSITVGGVAATGTKVTLGKTSSDDDTVTALTPASTATTAQAVKIAGEYGTVAYVNGVTPQTFTYSNAINVAPSGSDGTVGRVITVNGAGFNNLTFNGLGATAAAVVDAKTSVVLVPAAKAIGTTAYWYTGGAFTAQKVCDNVDVISDSQLTCTIPDLNNSGANYGAYNVVLATFASNALVTAKSTVYSRDSAYTTAAY